MEKCSERKMREFVATVAGPRTWTDTRQSWLARAARKSGVTYRQAKSLWYGEISDPNHLAARAMRDAAIRAGKQEAADLAARFERIAGVASDGNQNLDSSDVAALLHAARALRNLDRAGTDSR